MPRWAAQVLAAGRRQQVTADRVDVDDELTDGLARVEQEGDTRGTCQCTDVIYRVHEAALGRDPADRDELDPVVEHVAQRVDRQLTVLVVRDDLDGRAGSPRRLEHRDHVARVLGCGGEDPVTGTERERIERQVPRASRVLYQRDLVGTRADQRRDRRVDLLEPVGGGVGRRVAADPGLELEMPDDGLERRRGRQGRAGIVEVDDMCAAGRVGAHALDVDRAPARPHARSHGAAQARRLARCSSRQSSHSGVK